MATITEAFESEQEFRGLLGRLAFQGRYSNRIVDDEGIMSASILANMTPEKIEKSLISVNRLFGSRPANTRIYFSSHNIDKIKALTTFLRRCKTTNRIPDIRLIGAREVNSYIDYFDNWNKSPQKIEGIVSSEDIKFDINKFVGFREKIETLTSSVFGHRGITIEYLLRAPSSNDRDGPIEEPTPDIYSGEFMAANAAFNGAGYEEDNKMLYMVLRHFLTGTPGWNVISRYSRTSDGRGAYLALRSRYESKAYFDVLKTEATKILTATYYKGDNSKFSWEKYISRHLEAHRKFEEVNEPLTESMKVMHFKTGIKDVRLESELAVARSIPEVNRTFDNFVNQLTEGVANRRSRQDAPSSTRREVSGITGGSGRGRGRRRGRFGGRGGRSFRGRGFRGGRGRGRGRNDIPNSITVDGKNLYPGRTYSQEEYSQLTYKQKGELRRARFGNTSYRSDDHSTFSSRNISSNETGCANNNNSHSNADENSSSNATDQLRKRRKVSVGNS